MGICVDQWRVSIGLFQCCIFSGHQTYSVSFDILFLVTCLKKLFQNLRYNCNWVRNFLESSFYNVQFLLIMCLLLLEAGDIERNPGPENNNSISIIHLNIRSIRNKIEYIQDNFLDFDILCFSESHLV